ncbi:histidine biosynthesis bifunctional protein HisB [Deinococcus carri]|uniref:D,D-heptose 1,7-bisphosphate phosphatase n=1 Tax=Deinococcus carri TaxID=1211323 RepID=A0ABP9W673_9DEIO
MSGLPAGAARKAVLLDKDGTLIEDVPYNVDPALIRLLPGVGEALRALHAAGYTLVVITNQSGVARGLFPEAALEGVEARLRELLAAEGVPLAGFLACPHHPEGTVAPYAQECECRKPQPGLLRRAARELGLDLSASWMVGDILNDVEAGGRAGCRTVLLDTGGETEWVPGPYRTPDVTARGWPEVAAVILQAQEEGRTDALRTP